MLRLVQLGGHTDNVAIRGAFLVKKVPNNQGPVIAWSHLRPRA